MSIIFLTNDGQDLLQISNPARAFDTHNIDLDMYLIHCGVKTEEFFGNQIDDLPDYKVSL